MRIISGLVLLLGLARVSVAQQAFSVPATTTPASAVYAPEEAWLDLRQSPSAHGIQASPSWVESVKLQPADESGFTVVRIRVEKPRGDYNILFFRLFFFDHSDHHPSLAAWDESGSQLIRSGPLGSGSEVENSDAVMIPMHGTTTIDLEIPGKGDDVRAAFLQWMTSSEIIHPAAAGAEAIPAPFAATTALRAPTEDSEQFGTVTATLAPDPIRIGGTADQAAIFGFDLEKSPLMALVSFEVASPRIDSPPEISVNGQSFGRASLLLPGLADPGYRGEMRALTKEMSFQYTGWVRAQLALPAAALHPGTNEIAIVNGTNATASVIRATQVQLKYLWDKSDYILKPER